MQASITAPEIDAASKAEIQPFKKLKRKPGEPLVLQ